MILLLANSYAKDIKEHFSNNKNENNNDNDNEFENEIENNDINFGWIILYYGICFFAAYLSWTANTKLGYPMDVKLACALNAYTFGIFYIMYYMYIKYSNKN
jgi:uncharacterized membrane protein YhdT